MAKAEFTTPIPDFPDVLRPFHQYQWSVWEEREELKQPQEVGHVRVKRGGREYIICKNGGTKLNRAEFAAPVITRLVITDLPSAPEMLSGIVLVDIPNTDAHTYAENLFEDGILNVNGGTGAGLGLPILGNTARAASVAATMQVFLDTEMFIALDTTSDVSLITSPFRNMSRGTAASGVGGIPPDEISPNVYFWLQRRGPTVAKAGGSVAQGAALTPAADGELVTATAGDPIVAYALELGADGSYIDVYLVG